jgi:hypothetical protein
MSLHGRRQRAALLAAVSMLVVPVFAGTTAQAKQARLFAGTFGGASSTTVNPYPLGGEAHAVAVDSVAGSSQGDVYVTDTANHRVEKFDSSGHFLLIFGKEVNKTAVEAGATRAGEEDVCPAAGHPADVCQSGTAASTPGALESPAVIAVDNSSGPSQGDVYVDTGSGREPRDETQIVGLSKNVTGGTFTLSFEGETTAPIAYNATEHEFQEALKAALEALPAIGPQNVFVEGSARGFFTVEFTNKLGAKDVSQLTVNTSGLVPSGATAEVEPRPQGISAVPDLVTKFDPQGQLLSGWASGGQLDGSLASGGPFAGVLGGIAVDPTGNLWVLGLHATAATSSSAPQLSSAQALEFGEEASSRSGWSAVNGQEDLVTPAPDAGLLVDAEDNLYFQVGNSGSPGPLLKFGPTGTRFGVAVAREVGSVGRGEGQLESYALDQNLDELFVTSEEADATHQVQRYLGSACHPAGVEKPCSPVESFGQGRLERHGAPYTGLAVDSSGSAHRIYVLGREVGGSRGGQVTAFAVETVPNVSTAKASGFTATTATLNGTVEPEGVPTTHCFFEWGTTTAYGNRVACAQGEVLSGSGTEQVSAELTGLTPGETYHFRLVASNANTDVAEEPSRGADFAFGPPLVLGTSALGVSASSAILQTELNANNLETQYRFEYDTIPYADGEGPHGISVPVPDAGLGSGAANVTRSEQVEGLAPATVYYYRVVATNTLGVTDGPGGSFTTQPAVSGSPLLDGRGWEMVSPPEKSGSLIRGMYAEDPAGVLQASADGSGLAYTAIGPFGQEASSSRSFSESQFLAFRGADGWSTQDVSTPREGVVGVIPGNTEGYKAFSEDLSLGAVQPRGVTPLSPLATETTPYLREANGEFLPLVDPLNVPSETVFDGNPDSAGRVANEPEIVGGSPDLHSVVIASCFKLTEDGVNSCAKEVHSLYVWHEGALQLASVLPNEQPAAVIGGGSDLGKNFQKRNAVSKDGTRLVFSVRVGSSEKGLYLRDIALAKTVQLDLPEPGAVGGAGTAQFDDMSADGSKVFFTDSASLTKNSNADNSHPDLYMCEIRVEGEALTCALKDLSVARNPGEAGAVLGGTIGTDSNGRYVYFAANGALAPGATPGDCISTNGTGTCGLYLYDTVTGSVKLVTMLSGADYMDWRDPLIYLAARVSPSGRFVAFVSRRSLTGYDNRDAVSGKPDVEVYLYDRLGDGGEGKLVCASCDPTGARPHGVEIVNDNSLLSEDEVWAPGTWIAAAIPGWTSYVAGESIYQSRYLSDSGRLFFDSVDALVPRDSNGTADVYEYEPLQSEGQPASNNCTLSSPTYSSQSGGCVDLVSSGSSPEESVFLDASESGDDVFFLTGAQLVPGDVDTALDIYDARVGGAVSEQVKPPACEGDACQNPVSAPDDPTPGSLTFQGPGNPLPLVSASVKAKAKPATRAQKLARALKACAGKPKRKRAACERQARRSYGPVGKAKKSNRGTHR